MHLAAKCSTRLSISRHLLGRTFASSSKVQLTRDGHRVILGIESSCDDSCAAVCVAPQSYGQQILNASVRKEDGGLQEGGVETTKSARIVSSIVLKQDHSRTSGIQPLNAANAHAASLPQAIMAALQEAKQKGCISSVTCPDELDAIAVTQGPGMGASLASGLGLAKMLSVLWNRPLVYTHHMAAHSLTPFLETATLTLAAEPSDDGEEQPTGPPLAIPFLTLLLSGGHTLLVLCRGPRDFKILATTNDDSIGDAFDKASRGLKISVNWTSTSPGAALEAFVAGNSGERTVPDDAEHHRERQKEEEEADKRAVKKWGLPVPFKNKAEFSYSGLKAALTRKIEQLEENSDGAVAPDEERRCLARAFQLAAFAQLEDKVKMALCSDEQRGKVKRGEKGQESLLQGDQADVKALVVSGGVASNQVLRRRLRSCLDSMGRQDIALHFPPISLCTDNAAMIAHAAHLDYQPTFDLTRTPRIKWSLEELEA